MIRRDVVTVAAAGDYGKPRAAVIVQSDAFPPDRASVIICQMTSELVEAPDFRGPSPTEKSTCASWSRPPAVLDRFAALAMTETVG
jgi:mRNA-degrading endonuclease toxin of MazEF toxin-antitoxin module